jgi:ATP-dependent HslUV protease subunit HslV
MSTIVAVKKNGVAVIAADTLSKRGSRKYSSKYIVNHSKILKIEDNYLAISGPTSAKVILQDYFDDENVDRNFHDTISILKSCIGLHQCLKDQYFLNPVEDEDAAFESSQMDILILNKQGIFGVTAYRSVQEFARFAACGMGDEYALGAMYALYDDPNRSAEYIAHMGIKAACEFYDGSNEPIISYSIELDSEKIET